MSNFLAGGAHILVDDAVYIEQAATIRREMAAKGAADIVTRPSLWRGTQIQTHPERVAPSARGLMDVRVRKALAYGIDRETLIGTIYEGQAPPAHTLVPPTVSYYADLLKSITTYVCDPRQAQQLMEQAGFSKGPDGYFTHPASGRFTVEVVAIANPQNEGERAAMASTWRSVGFDITEATMALAQSQDGEARAKFSGLFTTGLSSGEDGFANYAITPTAENRWSGGNRGSWSHPEFVQLGSTYQNTLYRSVQIQQITTLARTFSDEVPSIAILWNPTVTPYVSALKGPDAKGGFTNTWRVQEWELS